MVDYKEEICQTKANINLNHLIIQSRKKPHRNELQDLENIIEHENTKARAARRELNELSQYVERL